jgi:putative ubiquitin-RnfH superfamily antitoxin RatB of RatAB toxin-antitoxin module
MTIHVLNQRARRLVGDALRYSTLLEPRTSIDLCSNLSLGSFSRSSKNLSNQFIRGFDKSSAKKILHEKDTHLTKATVQI